MSNRYAIVDADGDVLNVIVWDGAAEHPIGNGKSRIKVDRGAPAEPGGRSLGGGRWQQAPEGEGA